VTVMWREVIEFFHSHLILYKMKDKNNLIFL
jgi:hypothetical protein